MEKTQTTESIVTISAGLLLVLLSVGLAVETPSAAVIGALLLLPLIVAGVNRQLYRYNFGLTVVYNIGLLILNDFLIRSYVLEQAPDNHDLLTRTFFVTLGVSIVTMLSQAGESGKQQSASPRTYIYERCCVAMSLVALTAIGYYYTVAG